VLEKFASTSNVTAPMPDPLAPLVTEIHVACDVDDQPHWVPATTLTVLVPETGSTVKLVGVTLYEQAPASCVTDTVCPAMVSVPVRGALVGFCCTMNVTAPMPEPVAPLLTVIQPTALTDVHEHEVPVMMLSVRWLASEPTANVVGVTVNKHWRASANEVPASQARTTSAQQRKILIVRFLNTGDADRWRPVALHRAGRSCGRPKTTSILGGQGRRGRGSCGNRQRNDDFGRLVPMYDEHQVLKVSGQICPGLSHDA
jgi:hypothetical protein